MFVKLLLLVLVLGVWAQNSKELKTGDCPPRPDVGICDMTCFADAHCQGVLKCCRTACGGTFCVKPIAKRIEAKGKPGECPETPTGPWVCSSRCALDSDCRGNKKCCRNRCGAMACTKPEM